MGAEVETDGRTEGKQTSDIPEDDSDVCTEWSFVSHGTPERTRERKGLLKQKPEKSHYYDASTKPITSYQRALSRFKSSARPSEGSSNSLRNLFKKDEAPTVTDNWWERAKNITLRVFKSLSLRAVAQKFQQCCTASAGLSSAFICLPKRRRESLSEEEAAERLAIQRHFAASLDMVREARPFNCSKEQCGWSQDCYSTQFSWESTPVHTQDQPAHSRTLPSSDDHTSNLAAANGAHHQRLEESYTEVRG